MKVFLTILGIVFLLLSILVFYVCGWFISGVGASGMGGGSASLLPLIVSAIPFVLGCV